MFSQTRYLESPSGARLAYHHAEASGSAKAILIISHGLAEHSLRYQHFADEMAKRGLHVYAHDHRGHGQTSAPDSHLGIFARRHGDTSVIEDLLAMTAHASKTHPGLPIVLFGHSMGGLIALNAAIASPDHFDALAIWNSNFNLGLGGHAAVAVLAIERMLKGSDTPSLILAKATFGAWGKAIPDHRTDLDWLSRDPAIVDRFIADPLCGFEPSVGMWRNVIAFAQAPMRAGKLDRLPRDLPIHLVGGGQDPATRKGRDMTWLRDRLIGKGFSNVTLKIFEDMRHETLNEIGKETAIADFADWCETHTHTVTA